MFLDRMNPPLPQLQALAFACVGEGGPQRPLEWQAHPKGQPKASVRPPLPLPGMEMVVQVLCGSLPMKPHVAFINLTARKCR